METCVPLVEGAKEQMSFSAVLVGVSIVGISIILYSTYNGMGRAGNARAACVYARFDRWRKNPSKIHKKITKITTFDILHKETSASISSEFEHCTDTPLPIT